MCRERAFESEDRVDGVGEVPVVKTTAPALSGHNILIALQAGEGDPSRKNRKQPLAALRCSEGR